MGYPRHTTRPGTAWPVGLCQTITLGPRGASLFSAVLSWGGDNGFQWGGWFCEPVDDWRVFVDRFFGILKTAEILRNARRGSFLGDQAKLKHLVKILPCPESFDDLPAAWCGD